jgi:hypothetical protein
MRWFIPTWNGDLRLLPCEGDPEKTTLLIEDPTPDEERVVNLIGAEAAKRGWIEWTPFSRKTRKDRGSSHRKAAGGIEFTLSAPLEQVGPVVSKIMKPGPAVLSAILFKDGRCITSSGTLLELQELSEAAAKEPEEKAAVAAATVKRPTPCCPECVAGAVGPASEVLLAFLSPDEHEMWARKRSIVVTGGLSGHRYRLSHRSTREAERQGRICFDLDDGHVLHFHDWSVPPEEEVLAAKLVLEHREAWLRNEATVLDCSALRSDIYKNPFGGHDDGVPDSEMVASFGRALQRLFS